MMLLIPERIAGVRTAVLLPILGCLVQTTYSFNPGPSFIPFRQTDERPRRGGLQDKVIQLERKQDAVEKRVEDFTKIVNKTVTDIQTADFKATEKASDLKTEMQKMAAGIAGYKSLMGSVSSDLMTVKAKVETGKSPTKPEADPKGCPVSKGYHRLNSEMCLRLSEWNDTRKWEESRRACQEEKADLITFRDAAEQKAVLDYLNQLGDETYSPVYPVMRLWVGMDKHTGFFTWVSDSKFEGGWDRFSPHNNWILQCVSIVYDGLTDAMCGSKRRYICQRKEHSEPSTEG